MGLQKITEDLTRWVSEFARIKDDPGLETLPHTALRGMTLSASSVLRSALDVKEGWVAMSQACEKHFQNDSLSVSADLEERISGACRDMSKMRQRIHLLQSQNLEEEDSASALFSAVTKAKYIAKVKQKAIDLRVAARQQEESEKRDGGRARVSVGSSGHAFWGETAKHPSRALGPAQTALLNEQRGLAQSRKAAMGLQLPTFSPMHYTLPPLPESDHRQIAKDVQRTTSWADAKKIASGTAQSEELFSTQPPRKATPATKFANSMPVSRDRAGTTGRSSPVRGTPMNLIQKQQVFTETAATVGGETPATELRDGLYDLPEKNSYSRSEVLEARMQHSKQLHRLQASFEERLQKLHLYYQQQIQHIATKAMDSSNFPNTPRNRDQARHQGSKQLQFTSATIFGHRKNVAA